LASGIRRLRGELRELDREWEDYRYHSQIPYNRAMGDPDLKRILCYWGPGILIAVLFGAGCLVMLSQPEPMDGDHSAAAVLGAVAGVMLLWSLRWLIGGSIRAKAFNEARVAYERSRRELLARIASPEQPP